MTKDKNNRNSYTGDVFCYEIHKPIEYGWGTFIGGALGGGVGGWLGTFFWPKIGTIIGGALGGCIGSVLGHTYDTQAMS